MADKGQARSTGEKLSKGRQKIELKRIQNDEDRLITFSKRRAGIYKKATEISTLCAVEVGVLVFSPSGKAFTYGVPSLEAVADRLLQRNNPGSGCLMTRPNHLTGNTMEEEINTAYDELSAHLEGLRKEGEELSGIKRGIQNDCWWDAQVEDLNAQEVEQFSTSMRELKDTADEAIRQINTRRSPLPHEVN